MGHQYHNFYLLHKLHQLLDISMSKLSPWLALVAIIWLQSIGGTNTNFSAYSSLLKSHLGITQVQLNNLAVASDVGKLFGWCSGVAASHLPLPIVLIIGAIIGFIGYGIQFLFLANKIATLSYWQFCLLQVLSGNSVCWINTVCYITAIRKFPDDHAVVVALSTSYAALSAKIYIAVAQVLLGANFRNKSVYLLLNCVVPIASALVLSSFLTESEQVQSKSRTVLMFVFVLASVTGVCAVVETTVPLLRNMKMSPSILLAMVGLVALVPLWKAREVIRRRYCIPITVSEETEENKAAQNIAEEERRRTRREHGLWKLLRSLEFWMYFLVYLCGATMGLVYANNLGQIAQSRGIHEAVLLSISSSFGFLGKLLSAPLSALARRKQAMSRSASVAVLMVAMAGSFLLLLNPAKASMFISTAIIGLCTGAITSIAVSITCDLFGAENFCINHNILIVNIPVGSLLFGYVAALIYDREGGGGQKVCVGVQCYRMTFIIWGCICVFGTTLSFWLFIRTRKFL